MFTLHHISRVLRIPLALFFMAAPRTSLHGQEAPRHEQGVFLSGGKKIRLERFRAPAKTDLPAILLVPESKSMDSVGPVYRAIASRIAADGFEVDIVHFF